MSGRVVWFRQGERTTGYRKTNRRNHRTPAHLLPDVTVSFMLEAHCAPKPGDKLGITGVRVGLDGHPRRVVVAGKSKDWALGQAQAFLRKVGVTQIDAVLRRADAPGPTISGPISKGYERVVTITVERNRATVVDDTASRTLFGT